MQCSRPDWSQSEVPSRQVRQPPLMSRSGTEAWKAGEVARVTYSVGRSHLAAFGSPFSSECGGWLEIPAGDRSGRGSDFRRHLEGADGMARGRKAAAWCHTDAEFGTCRERQRGAEHSRRSPVTQTGVSPDPDGSAVTGSARPGRNPHRCASRRCPVAVMRWPERAGVWHGKPDWGNPGPAGVLMPKSGRVARWWPNGAEAGVVCGATSQRRMPPGETPAVPSFQGLEAGGATGWMCVQKRAEYAQGGVGCSARASALRAGCAVSRCRQLPTPVRSWGVGAHGTWNGTEARRGAEDDRA